MTILGGDYSPIEVRDLDLVGHTFDGQFVIINPIKERGREFPDPGPLESMPLVIRALATRPMARKSCSRAPVMGKLKSTS